MLQNRIQKQQSQFLYDTIVLRHNFARECIFYVTLTAECALTASHFYGNVDFLSTPIDSDIFFIVMVQRIFGYFMTLLIWYIFIRIRCQTAAFSNELDTFKPRSSTHLLRLEIMGISRKFYRGRS